MVLGFWSPCLGYVYFVLGLLLYGVPSFCKKKTGCVLQLSQLIFICEIVVGYDLHLILVPSYLNNHGYITYKNLAWVLWLQVLRQNNGRLGVAGICNGGGGASALVLELM